MGKSVKVLFGEQDTSFLADTIEKHVKDFTTTYPLAPL